ncbi:MAG: hypothetical protein ASARMPRED_001201 [Alectoria sarmentosa]|nr:MAG: hypothetical protein ASARMPRED_001201 [Alectoria sarmentosa]
MWVGWRISKKTVTTITHATRPQDFAVRLELPSTGLNDISDRDEHATEFEFLQDVSRQVFDMTFKSRVRPSKEKFQHLLFLNDCRKRTELDMTSNLRLVDECAKILKRIVPIVDDTEEAKLLQEIMSKLGGEIQYIREELEIVGKNIEKLQTEIESQNNLQSRNTTILTTLAAIYVPLAFVTVS